MITIHQADCLDLLRTLDDASVDAIVTDPPYGLADHKPKVVTAAITAWTSGDREHVPDGKGFMGRAWDAFVPPPAVWDECLRVLKPGGHLLCFAGTRTVDLMGLSIRLAGFEIRDSITWMHGQGFPKGKAQLKPASEPILVARKKGPLWLGVDACRVQSADKLVRPSVLRDDNEVFGKGLGAGVQDEPAGRWPSNVVLSHGPECNGECQNGCPVAELDEQSGTLSNCGGPKRTTHDAGMFGIGQPGHIYSDSGGASRFFPVFKYQAKAPTKERPKVDGVSHPTVKPLALMRWLVRLVTPPGGLVLDPFAGSGTTGEAAALEGFRAVLVEAEAAHIPLIEARLVKAELEFEMTMPEFEVHPDPEPEPPTLLELIAEAADDAAMTVLWEAHGDVWTDEHTAAVRARLAVAA